MFRLRFRDARRERAPFAAFATCALLLLALGGAAHLEHHIADPHCDRGPAPESHACGCSSLHGGAIHADAPGLAAATTGFAAPSLTPHARIALDSPRRACAPRAPPLV